MVMPIQSLMNMEMMLYGGYGMNTNAPSFYNNYTGRAFGDNANNQVFNNYPSFYGYNNTNFGQTIPSIYTQSNQQQTSNNVFAGLNDKEKAALVDNYVKGMSPSESFLGAAAGAAGFSVLFHPRVIAHPINTFKSLAETNKIFADVTKSGTNLAKAWADAGLNEVVRDAYTATNRIVARSYKGKKGLHIWRKGLADGEAEALLKPMKEALKNFNPENSASVEALIKETEALKAANVKNGLLPRAWNGIKNIFRSEKRAIPTALEGSKNTKVIEEAVSKAVKAGKAVKMKQGKSYLATLKTSGGGIGGAIFFLAIEYLTGWSKIKACFNKDKKTGMKQLGQTTVKGIGSAAGWAAGEALGVCGTAKLCAAAGTAIAPGVGTAIGAVAGMIVGSIGCWLAGKITNKLVGQDVGDKIEAENMAKSEEGQAQLLQYTMEKIQKGEKIDPQAEAAVHKLISQYA